MHAPESAMSPIQPYQTGVSDTIIESEASLRFLAEQTGLLEIITELDPTWMERMTSGRGKKNPMQDRKLHDLAMKARQRRMRRA